MLLSFVESETIFELLKDPHWGKMARDKKRGF